MNPAHLIACVGQLAARRPPPRTAVAALVPLLAAFAAQPVQRWWPGSARQLRPGTRLLLNHPADNFQIVIVPWAPGSRSLIHDHAGAVGAVAALQGATLETKYGIAEEVDGLVRLTPLGRMRLCGRVVTPLLPEDGLELHDMVHAQGEPAVTAHVYLQPLLTQDVYTPRPDGLYRRERRPLSLDALDAWHRWTPARRARNAGTAAAASASSPGRGADVPPLAAPVAA